MQQRTEDSLLRDARTGPALPLTPVCDLYRVAISRDLESHRRPTSAWRHFFRVVGVSTGEGRSRIFVGKASS